MKTFKQFIREDAFTLGALGIIGGGLLTMGALNAWGEARIARKKAEKEKNKRLAAMSDRKNPPGPKTNYVPPKIK